MISRTASRVLSPALLAGALFTVGSCADRPTEVEVPAKATAEWTGTVVSSVWQSSRAGLEYWGSVAADVSTSEDRPIPLNARLATPAPSEIEAMRRTFQRSAWSEIQGDRGALAPSPQDRRVPRRHKTIRTVTAEGDRLRIEFVENPQDPRGAAMGMVVFRNDRLAMVTTFTRERGGLMPTTARTATIDSDGTVTTVQTDLSGLTRSEPLPVASALGPAKSALARACNAATEFLGPEPLMAAAIMDEAGCTSQEIALALAVAENILAQAAVVLAVGSCSTGVLCPAAILALAYLAKTAVALAAAEVDLENCYNTPPPPPSEPLVRERGGSADDNAADECVEIIWEISYDGGRSWHYFWSDWFCG